MTTVALKSGATEIVITWMIAGIGEIVAAIGMAIGATGSTAEAIAAIVTVSTTR